MNGFRKIYRVAPLLLISSTALSTPISDEASILAVEEWVADPRSIDELELSDLVRLPWVDEPTAVALLALRDFGGLKRPQDLGLVPGLEREEIAALLPLLRGWESAKQEDRRLELDLRRGGGAVWGMRAERSGEHVGIRWRQSEARAAGSLELRRGAWKILGGRQRPGLGSALLEAGGRSRTAPLSRAASGPRLRSSSALSGGTAVDALALQYSSRHWVGLGGVGAEGAWWSTEWRGQNSRIGVAMREDCALWIQFDDARYELARSRQGRWRSALRFGVERNHWRLLWSATNATGAGVGSDPISGHALDREHRSWQFQAAKGASRLRGEFLLRRIWREGSTPRQRMQLRLRDLGSAAWGIRLRMDEELGAGAGDPAWQVDLSRNLPAVGRGQWRVALRRRLPGASELWTLRWRPVEKLALEWATARGRASQVWIPPLAGLAFAPTWLAPAESAFSAAFRRGVLGIWMGGSAPSQGPIQWQGGLSFGWRGRWCEGC